MSLEIGNCSEDGYVAPLHWYMGNELHETWLLNVQIRANTLSPKGKTQEVTEQMKTNWNMFVTTYHTKQSVLWRFSSILLWDSSSVDPTLIPLYTRLKISTVLIEIALHLKSGLIWIDTRTTLLSINQQMVLESNSLIKTEVLQLSRSKKRYTKFLIHLKFWDHR